MDRAKEAIVASFNNKKEKYRSIFEFIDKRWNVQLHRPLYAAGYFLNPEYFYSNLNIENDTKVMEDLYKCISRLLRADWWSSYGASTPELKTFTMKILILACSSSSCEHNWSVFEHIHSKKRNRLSQQRLNDLLLGKLDDSNIDNDNDFAYEGEDLRWSDVARASGVGESAYDFRFQNASSSKGASSSASAKRKQFSAQTSLVNEEEINLDDETDEDTDGYKSSD
ncbi:uncharacterized protein LOC122011123 [Zingiber officinale]|uniref:uncharacterized protein LOC122011123 n=1 Tax=Zingiber officinale TaxID=94328 RepID=UPI001C4C569D|nr:uncharacterized protein LOC122011123 [Zingiber officinale]